MSCKTIIILSENDFLYNALSEVNFLPHILVHIKDPKDFQQYKKNDVTIIDQWSHNSDYIVLFSKYIISLQNPPDIKSHIIFNKPIRLSELVSEINNCLINPKLFALINDSIIYDELGPRIGENYNIVNLTAKENLLIKEGILSKDFYLSRDFILHSIWKYSTRSQTNTIESHIHKLRNKIPFLGLQPYKQGYRFNVWKIVY